MVVNSQERPFPSRVHIKANKLLCLPTPSGRHFLSLPFHKGCTHFRILAFCSYLSSNSCESGSKSHFLPEMFLNLTNPPREDKWLW